VLIIGLVVKLGYLPTCEGEKGHAVGVLEVGVSVFGTVSRSW